VAVRCVGHLLEFLDLAELKKRTKIGWKAKPRFFQLARNTEVLTRDPNERSLTHDNRIVINMLTGIATGEKCNYFLCKDKQRPTVLVFTLLVLQGLGLTREECEPTPLLRELLVHGAVKIRDAARAATYSNRGRFPKKRTCGRK
jgi:hypothetical protein